MVFAILFAWPTTSSAYELAGTCELEVSDEPDGVVDTVISLAGFELGRTVGGADTIMVFAEFGPQDVVIGARSVAAQLFVEVVLDGGYDGVSTWVEAGDSRLSASYLEWNADNVTVFHGAAVSGVVEADVRRVDDEVQRADIHVELTFADGEAVRIITGDLSGGPAYSPAGTTYGSVRRPASRAVRRDGCASETVIVERHYYYDDEYYYDDADTDVYVEDTDDGCAGDDIGDSGSDSDSDSGPDCAGDDIDDSSDSSDSSDDDSSDSDDSSSSDDEGCVSDDQVLEGSVGLRRNTINRVMRQIHLWLPLVCVLLWRRSLRASA